MNEPSTVPHHPLSSPNADPDTIAAISTPPGRGGIGIVRLSGPQALAIASGLVRMRSAPEPGRVRLAAVPDADTGCRIDEAVVTYFAAPNSYTGEDLVEIAAHGSPVILDMLVRLALRDGARLARPGEFTERAFLAGRMDLTQAEAVRDLIEAQTLFQARVAAEQMGGSISRRIQPAKENLIQLIAVLEAGIDFAEDDVEVAPPAEIVTRIDTIAVSLQALARSFEQGRIIREGLRLAILGRPNVGKSSLFNRLLDRERAIVTATPGTTRDLVTEHLSLAGVPVELVDTAGLRETEEEAEALGIRKSREMLADADLILLVVDASRQLSAEEQELIASLSCRRALIIRNKSDLVSPKAAWSEEQGTAAPEPGLPAPVLNVSALTGQGIDELRGSLAQMVRHPEGESENGVLTSLRHFEAVQGALASLEAARRGALESVPHEMLLLDLYEALKYLDALTGQTTSDDILGTIFSTFCIGK